MQVVRLIAIIIASGLLSACGDLTLEIFDESAKVYDFQKTEIVVGGSNVADGISEMIVVIHLKNSDNSAVPNYKPTYNVVPSYGLYTSECTQSTDNGISVCVLKASVPGTKTFKLTNAKVGLEKLIQFEPLRGGQMFGLASGSHNNMSTAAGHKVKVSVGEATQGTKTTTASGYKVSVSVRTGMDSL